MSVLVGVEPGAPRRIISVRAKRLPHSRDTTAVPACHPAALRLREAERIAPGCRALICGAACVVELRVEPPAHRRDPPQPVAETTQPDQFDQIVSAQRRKHERRDAGTRTRTRTLTRTDEWFTLRADEREPHTPGHSIEKGCSAAGVLREGHENQGYDARRVGPPLDQLRIVVLIMPNGIREGGPRRQTQVTGVVGATHSIRQHGCDRNLGAAHKHHDRNLVGHSP